MPRPRKSRDDSLSRRIHFRVSTDEYARLEAEAYSEGLSPHQLARLRSLRDHKRSRHARSYRRADPALIAQLKRIGTNLNQLVKSAHYFKTACPGEVSQLCNRIAQIIHHAIEDEFRS